MGLGTKALSKMKIAYVTSEGGHLTELLYIHSVIKGADDFFVTFDSPRTRALPIRKFLVPDFWGHPTKVISGLISILGIVVREKPDVIISTGSEIAIPFFFIGKLLGIKTVFIESYTRVDEATATGKIVYPFTDVFLVNWEELLPYHGRKAIFLGGLFKPDGAIDTVQSEARKQVLALVGMNFRTFDRLLKVMDKVAEDSEDEVVLQLGSSEFKPSHAKYFDFKPYDEVLEMIKSSRALVCQGAMCAVDGLIHGCDVIVVPRSSKYGEVLNDHQVVFSEKLAELGLLRTAYDIEDVRSRLMEPPAQGRQKLVINREMIRKMLEKIAALR